MNGIINCVKKNNNELIELSVCLDELFRMVAGQKQEKEAPVNTKNPECLAEELDILSYLVTKCGNTAHALIRIMHGDDNQVPCDGACVSTARNY